MGKGQDTNPIARREAIEACVRAWIRNNPDEFVKFKGFMSAKRVGMTDRKFGRMSGDEKSFGDDKGEWRLQGSIPQSLMMAMDELMKYHNQGRLFLDGTEEDRKAETNWFFKKFNVFMAAEKL
jgi:hypothetical protein